MRDQLNQWFDARSPRMRAALAFALGTLATLALPPIGIFPLLWLVFPLLLLLVRGAATARQAFIAGWCFAFGYFLFGLYWIAAALFVDLAKFYWLVPFAVAGLPALLAGYYGLATLIWHRWWRGDGVVAAVSFAVLFAAAEYVRGYCFSGFPWNLFGYAWAEFLPVAQSVSLIGSYGLTLLTLLAACLPLAWLKRKPLAGTATLAAIAILVGVGFWGLLRMRHVLGSVPGAYVRLVQPNISQQMKWNKTQQDQHFQQLLAFSAAPSAQPLTHIIWPETAVTFDLDADQTRRSQLAAALPSDAVLLTGTVRREPNYATNRWDYFNSLIAFDKNAATLARYDKVHLVPFGEYVPLRGFGPVAAATAGLGSFIAGKGAQTITIQGLPPFSPLICYEVIFPGAVKDAAHPPRLLINITNDGWYGHTAGPHQHLAISRMRAIEEGMPLLRVANTGISAVVDAYGRILQSQPLGTEGVIDTSVPQARQNLTIYGRIGNLGFFILWGILAAACLLRRKNNIVALEN